MKGEIAPIYLVGPMGSGKTTLGRRVAKELGLEFIDCDEEIERQTGASVNLIFDIEGEAGFRLRETRMIEDLAKKKNILVATGGGVVITPRNREVLRQAGVVVWLKTSVTQQLRRLAQDKKRPLLQAPDRRKRLEALAAERDSLYEEVSHLEFCTGNRSLAVIARQLSQAIRQKLEQDEEGTARALN